jgi:hypothetical protein
VLDALVAAAGPGSAEVLEAADLAVQLRRTRATHLATLRQELPPNVPVAYLPELFARMSGRRATAQVAAALDDELGS